MRAKKIDANQNLIVQHLRQIGCSVAITSMVGNGFPDIVVGFRDKNFLFELKDGKKFKSQKELTQKEAIFHLRWEGQIDKIENFTQALEIMNA